MDFIDIKEDCNPWAATSILDFSYFCCPECDSKSQNKQDFVDHTVNYHSWALETLRKISDGSLDDVEFPNDQRDEFQVDIKKEFVNNSDIDVDDIDYKNDPLDQSKVQVHDLPIKKEKNVKKRAGNSELNKCLGEKEAKYQCQICPAKFVKRMEANKHLKSDHAIIKRKCAQFVKNPDLLRKDACFKDNLVLKDGKKRYKCSTCDKIFKFSTVLELHIDEVHEKKKSHLCPKCKNSYTTKGRLKSHYEQVHEKKNRFKCEKCEKGFYRKNQLEQHILKVHENKRPFTCEICGKTYINKSALNLHSRTIHEGIRNYIKYCHSCLYKTESKREMDYHIALKHELKINSIDETNLDKIREEIRDNPKVEAIIAKKLAKVNKTFCKICEKSVYGSRAHQKEYHKGIVKCPKCDEEFSKYSEAMLHYDGHHDKRPCAVCGAVILKSTMARHIAMKHTAIEDRKFKCTFCPKAFIGSKGLKDHINTHTGEKPYICKFCGKGSASFGTHRGHERSHEGYKRTK